MQETYKLVKRINTCRTLRRVIFFSVLVFVMLFGSEVSFGDAPPQPLFLSTGACVAVIVVDIIACLAWYFFDIIKINNILFAKCDPQKFLTVQTATFWRNKKYDAEMFSTHAVVALHMGNVEESLSLAAQSELDKFRVYKIGANIHKCSCAYFMEKPEMYKTATNQLKILIGNNERLLKKYALPLQKVKLIGAIMQNDKENGVKIAESINLISQPALSWTTVCFYKGVAYLMAEDRDKAIHNFMTSSELGGTSFFAQKSKEYIEKLTTHEAE